jgi:AcrR family transcriptional regulator
VVAAAAKVFSAKGFGASTLEDVAREVGILKGSLYNYISSKEDLLFAVVRPPAQRLLETAHQLRDIDLPPSEKVRRLTHTHVEIIDEYFPYVTVYVHEISGKHTSEEWAAMDHEYLTLLDGVLSEGEDQGVFSPGMPRHITALSLIGALNWMTRWYRAGDPAAARAIADQIADVFLSGLLARR